MYRKLFFVSIGFVFIFCLLHSSVSAHGGIEKSTGDYTIYINQSPISPFVGEQVKMNFVVLDKVRDIRPENLDVTLTVTDTFTGDASKDKKIFEQKFRTDVNGSFDFTYRFNKENFFDIDLSFIDDNKKLQETGFLIQPRMMKKQDKAGNKTQILYDIGFFTAGFFLSGLLGFRYKLK